MLFENVSIASLSYIDAPNVVTSYALEERLAPVMERLNLSSNIIHALTGIKERRFWDPGVEPSHVATQAAIRAIEMAGIDKSQIGVIVNTSVCKDYIEPSIASLVHGNLNLSPSCLNFDIGNACLAFLNAIEVVGNMIERGQVDYGLIVDGEGSRYVVDKTIERLLNGNADEATFRANFATLTLGSGSAAMILAKSSLIPDGHKVVGSVSLSATKYNQLCRGQRDEMLTDAGKLLTSGIELASNTYAKAQEDLEWKNKQFNEYVIHQVSASHTAKLVETLKLDVEKVYKIYNEFGNIGPAAIPITLGKVVESGRVSKGDRIGLLGIGSGLNCSMMEVVW